MFKIFGFFYGKKLQFKNLVEMSIVEGCFPSSKLPIDTLTEGVIASSFDENLV